MTTRLNKYYYYLRLLYSLPHFYYVSSCLKSSSVVLAVPS